MDTNKFKEAAERIAIGATQYLGKPFTAGHVSISLSLTQGGPMWTVTLAKTGAADGEHELAAQSLHLDGSQLAEWMADELDALDMFDPLRSDAEATIRAERLNRLKDGAIPSTVERLPYLV